MTEREGHPNQVPLESWKEIAAYLKRDVRTVKRWEKHEALPVRRHLHQARSSVYAYPSELEAWKAARQPGFDKAPLVMPWRRPLPALGFAVTLLLALVSVASGPILTPPGALAQEAGGMVARQVWGVDAEFHGAVSPDGRYLSYTDWVTGDLAVRELATREKRHLTNKGTWEDSDEFAVAAAWSPDSQQLAYGWFNKEGFYELRTIGLDGSQPRVLYRDEEINELWPGLVPYAWSPDGKHVLASFPRKDGTTRIGLVSVADSSVQVLKTLASRFPGNTSFSPDGRYIVYDFPPREDSPARDIFLLATDGSREITLVEHPANDSLLGWVPNSSQVLFASDRTGTRAAWVIQVADGKRQGSPVLVKKDLGRAMPLGFGPNASFYYAVSTAISDVYVATLDPATGKLQAPPTKAAERLVGSNRLPDWSPDGNYLAYVSEPPDHHFALAAGVAPRIIIRSLKTGKERELLPALSYIDAIRWSPDGRSFLVGAWDTKGREGSYQIDAQTGEVTPIVHNEPRRAMGGADWSRDGKAIFYSYHDEPAETTHILLRDLETGREKELYRGHVRWQVRGLAPSPDGRQLAFVMQDWATQSFVLMVMPTAGGEPRELLRLPVWVMSLAWTPDGRAVVFVRDIKRPLHAEAHTHELWRVPAEGGEPQPLGLALQGLIHLRIHPDGRRIVFHAGKTGKFRAEVWVLENFLPELEAEAARLEE